MSKKISKILKSELENLIDKGSLNGFMGTEIPISPTQGVGEDRPTYIAAESEKVISKNNSYIILGNDRLGDVAHGFGGLGTPNSNCIDLVVGLGSSNIDGIVKGSFLTTEDYVNKDPVHDAARIYITQRADIDAYFNEQGGSVYKDKKNKGVSGVAVKADTVLIQGRRNIKIKAGLSLPKETDAHGAKLPPAKIELIAGGKLEPLVKGNKLVSCLRKMNKQISSNRAVIVKLCKQNIKLRAQLAGHMHPTNTGVALPSPNMIAHAATNIPKDIADILDQLNKDAQLGIDIVNHLLMPNKDRYILSSRVYTS